nr:unnamed protein product [Callosobruchus chinensis]
MPGCAVANCKNYNRVTKGSGVKYFRFPKNEDLAKQWVIACRRKDEINLKNACICSKHFDNSCFEIPLRQKLLDYTPKNSRHLKPDAIPILNLPGCHEPNSENKEERSARLMKRSQHKTVTALLNSSTSGISEPVQQSTNYQIRICYENLLVIHYFRASQMKIKLLEEKVMLLEKQNAELIEKSKKLEEATALKYKSALATIFTQGQIKKLFGSGNKRIRWSPDDIASAVSLRSVSPKAYRYLRVNNYPLPAMSTLRKWVASFDVSHGILRSVITLMQKKSSDFTQQDRICVLTFDEIYISNKIELDKKTEQVIGPHKSCQTVMVRGLLSKWKQPIYYNFDQPMMKDTIEKIVSELFQANFVVVAITSDMGTGNTSLWSQLGIGYDKKCFINHPCDNSLKIFVFADPPHLIKLARNHLIDHGFVVDNKLINIDYFEALLNISTSELTLAHKLTPHHLCLKGSLRQKVRPAVQLLSNSVAQAVNYAGENGLMPKDSYWKEAAVIVQLFNDWFDLLNSRSKIVANCPTRNAYGTNLDEQTVLLDKMSDLVNSMRVGNHKGIIPFQKGILLTSRSLKALLPYLQEKYNVEYILTSRLNQDVLENFFSYIRGMGGANDHPSPLDFKYRLRWYILGKHSAAIFTESRNTIESSEPCLSNISTENPLQSAVSTSEDICLTQKMLSNLVENTVGSKEPQFEEETILQSTFVEAPYLEDHAIDQDIFKLAESYEIKEKIHRDSLKYVAGFVAYKFKHKYNLGSPTESYERHAEPDWLQTISRGSLLYPNEEMWKATLALESSFHSMHGSSLSKETKIFQKLTQNTFSQLEDSTIPFEVILCLSRTRTYIRLREMNKKISFSNCQRKLDKKMSKFVKLKK